MIRKDSHKLLAVAALTWLGLTLTQPAARAQSAAAPAPAGSDINTVVAVICQATPGGSAVTVTSNTVSVAVAAPIRTQAVYRLYSAAIGDHFYTANPAEEAAVAASGWYGLEGVIGYAPAAPAPGTAPVHRLYNPATGEHFYTVSAAERDAVAAWGWNSEGVAWQVFTAPGPGTLPLYRLYSPAAGRHFYTTGQAEHDFLVAHGFNDEGVIGYLDAGP